MPVRPAGSASWVQEFVACGGLVIMHSPSDTLFPNHENLRVLPISFSYIERLKTVDSDTLPWC